MPGRLRDELPPPTFRRFDWQSAVTYVMKHPNKWYMAFKGASQNQVKTVERLEADALRGKPGKFEAAIRNSRNGKGEMWLRYTPPTDDDSHLLDELEADDL